MKFLREKKIPIICISICCMILAAMVCFPAFSYNVFLPTLFVNDDKFSSNAYPLEVINGVEYIPAYMFVDLPGSTVTNRGGNQFIIEYKNKYLSCNASSGDRGGAYYGSLNAGPNTNGEFIDLDILLYNKTWYVPARRACQLLGVDCESTGFPYRFRIYDSSAKLTFDEVQWKYYPMPTTTEPETLPPPTVPEVTIPPDSPNTQPLTDPVNTEPNAPTAPQATTRPAATDPTTTEATTEPEDTTPRTASIYFAGAPGDGEVTREILQLLDERGIKAKFYVTRADVAANPALIREYIVRGHTLGIYVPKMAASDQYANYVDSVNELLCAATKYSSFELLGQDEAVKMQISQTLGSGLGYRVAGYQFTADSELSAPENAEAAFKLFQGRTSTAILFGHTAQQLQTLKQFVKLTDTKDYYSIS